MFSRLFVCLFLFHRLLFAADSFSNLEPQIELTVAVSPMFKLSADTEEAQEDAMPQFRVRSDHAVDEISDLIFQNLELDALPPRFSGKKALKAILVGMSCSAGIPLSGLAKKAAGDNIDLQNFLVTSTLMSSGVSRMWAFSNVIDIMFNSDNSPKENLKKKILKHTVSNILSVFSSIPMAYLVYRDSSNIVYPIITFMSEYSLSCLGYYELFNNAYSKKKIKNTSQCNGIEYDELTSRAKENEKLALLAIKLSCSVLTMDEGQFTELRTSLENSISTSSVDQFVLLLTKASTLEDKMTSKEKFVYAIYKGTFYVIPISNFVLNSFLSYSSSKAFYDSLFFAVPYVALSTVPSFVVSLIATHHTAEDIYDELYRKKENKRSFLKKNYPVSHYATMALSLLFASGAATWGTTVTKEALEETPIAAAIPYFATTAALGIVIFESFALRDFTNNMFMVASEYGNNAFLQGKISLSRQLRKVGSAILNS